MAMERLVPTKQRPVVWVATPIGEPQGNAIATAIRSYGHHNEILARKAPCHLTGTAVIGPRGPSRLSAAVSAGSE
eukprot:scaffold15199_cov151-Skeletonema_dohrnii-CCMP3373.AAC.2